MLDHERVPSARATNPQNWRATDPSTGARQPKKLDSPPIVFDLGGVLKLWQVGTFMVSEVTGWTSSGMPVRCFEVAGPESFLWSLWQSFPCCTWYVWFWLRVYFLCTSVLWRRACHQPLLLVWVVLVRDSALALRDKGCLVAQSHLPSGRVSPCWIWSHSRQRMSCTAHRGPWTRSHIVRLLVLTLSAIIAVVAIDGVMFVAGLQLRQL